MSSAMWWTLQNFKALFKSLTKNWPLRNTKFYISKIRITINWNILFSIWEIRFKPFISKTTYTEALTREYHVQQYSVLSVSWQKYHSQYFLLQNPTKSFKMTMPPIFSHSHILQTTWKCHISYDLLLFYFHGLKFIFINILLDPWNRAIVTLLIFPILGT